MNESAGGVIVGPDGRIVVVEQHGNSWALPKGHVEGDETLLQAALREIREETGLTKLVLIKELGSYERYSIGKNGIGENKEWGKRRRTFFLFHTEETTLAPSISGGEISRARFVSIDEALALLTHPKDREFLESVRATIDL